MKLKSKTNKTIILIKQIYEKISCLENMYNCETFSLDSIEIYDGLFFDIYDCLRTINICLLSFKNDSIITEFNKIRVNLNQLNYTLRSIIILVCLNQCKNTNEQGLINFENIFNPDDINYEFTDISGCIILDEYKTINILSENFEITSSVITFDFNNQSNPIFLKNKVDYIIDSKIENIYCSFKDIIKNIKIYKKINDIKEERKKLNNKYNINHINSDSIGEQLENILDCDINENLVDNLLSNFLSNFKKTNKKLINYLSTTYFFKIINYILIIIIFKKLLKYL